ncbi:hypothetical protein SLA2020_529040 [Shorea laevis]
MAKDQPNDAVSDIVTLGKGIQHSIHYKTQRASYGSAVRRFLNPTLKKQQSWVSNVEGGATNSGWFGNSGSCIVGFSV